MEKLIFTDPSTKEDMEVFVLEETKFNEKDYLLVTLEESGDSDALVLRQEADDEGMITYTIVEDDNELSYMADIFAELLEDVDFEM